MNDSVPNGGVSDDGLPDEPASDDQVRDGIVALMDEALDPMPFPADRLGSVEPDRAATGRSGRLAGLPRHLAVAAAIIAAVVAGLGLWALGDDDARVEVVDDSPHDQSGFEGWEPGWHTIDLGESRPMYGHTSVTWTGDELVVAGIDVSEIGFGRSSAFSFDPQTNDWTKLPDPPFGNVRVVAADQTLVAVGYDDRSPAEPDYGWATLEPGAREWEVHGPAPVAPKPLALSPGGPDTTRGQLVWTGSRVIDVGLGGVLDPATGDATTLPMPDDFVEFFHLATSTPVWTGQQVVLTSDVPQPGLAWDGEGTEWTALEAAPSRGVEVADGVSVPAVADGQVVLVTPMGDQPGWASTFDPQSGEWTELPDVPGAARVGCTYRAAAVGEEVIVQPCPDGRGTPLRLDSDRWTEIDPVPYDEKCCAGPGGWLGTPNALITWSSVTDSMDIPTSSELAVWIPGGDEATPADGGPDGSDEPAPAASGYRGNAVELWTGSEYLVWGGQVDDDGSEQVDGWMYDPVESSTTDVPAGPISSSDRPAGVWTGEELIVAGGQPLDSVGSSGYVGAAAYDPSNESWRKLSTFPRNALGPKIGAVWTGSEMLVVTDVVTPVHSLSAYDPATDAWRVLTPPGEAGPSGQVHWTGDQLILWTTGRNYGPDFGQRYDPQADRWTPLPSLPPDATPAKASSVWTGDELVVWGINHGPDDTVTNGYRWSPTDDVWTPMSPAPIDPVVWGKWTPGSQAVGFDADTGLVVVVSVDPSVGAEEQRPVMTYDPDADRWELISTQQGLGRLSAGVVGAGLMFVPNKDQPVGLAATS